MKRIRLRTQASLCLRSAHATQFLRRPHETTTLFSLSQCRSYSAPITQDRVSASSPAEDGPPPVAREVSSGRRKLGDEALPSPRVERSLRSAKLAALHARLSLPSRFPIQTLARTLVTPSADPNPHFNNAALEVLGSDLLGYYTAEHILCHYPRIPQAILFAAQSAYVGSEALATIAREWGVETAAHPGGEVDPGLLQLRRLPPGAAVPENPMPWKWAQHRAPTVNARVAFDDQFGDLPKGRSTPLSSANFRLRDGVAREPVTDAEEAAAAGASVAPAGIPVEHAYRAFVRALVGALHLHCGPVATKRFVQSHVLSRRLDYAALFDFRQPQRELSVLCGREGFEPPVARLISETGRLSRHPVYVVGVYSGRDKLGEAAGASLVEARVRAAAVALKAWYLYSPLEVTVPSETEHAAEGAKWLPNMVDYGEVFA